MDSDIPARPGWAGAQVILASEFGPLLKANGMTYGDDLYLTSHGEGVQVETIVALGKTVEVVLDAEGDSPPDASVKQAVIRGLGWLAAKIDARTERLLERRSRR